MFEMNLFKAKETPVKEGASMSWESILEAQGEDTVLIFAPGNPNEWPETIRKTAKKIQLAKEERFIVSLAFIASCDMEPSAVVKPFTYSDDKEEIGRMVDDGLLPKELLDKWVDVESVFSVREK